MAAPAVYLTRTQVLLAGRPCVASYPGPTAAWSMRCRQGKIAAGRSIVVFEYRFEHLTHVRAIGVDC